MGPEHQVDLLVARQNYFQNSFTSGKFTPLLSQAKNFDKFRNALKEETNFISKPYGAIERRPGFYKLALTKNPTGVVRLLSFQFSTTQSYIIEVGAGYARFFMNGQPVQLNGAPYELSLPFTTDAQIAALQTIQSNDILFLFSAGQVPQKLSRYSDTNWTVTPLITTNGPYLPFNITDNTLTASASTGSVTITAASSIFAATDVGRLVALNAGGVNGNATITSFASPTSVTAMVNQTVPTTATSNFALGSYGPQVDEPNSGFFYEDRLALSTLNTQANTVNLSTTGNYYDFTPGTASDSALQITLLSREYDAIQWIFANKVLILGTNSGIWAVSSSNFRDVPLTPDNIRAVKEIAYGVDSTPPVQMGKASIFLQYGRQKIRELSYSIDIDGFDAPELSLLAEDITGSGVSQLTPMRLPYEIVWMVRDDGVLLSMTYLKDQGVCAFAEHPIGGDAVVQSINCIQNGTIEELWATITRTINGAVVRTIERMSQFFLRSDPYQAHFLDSGLSYNGMKDSQITIMPVDASPGYYQITANANVFNSEHVGAEIVLLDSNNRPTLGRVGLTGYVNATHMVGQIIDPPLGLTKAALDMRLKQSFSNYAIAIRVVTGLDHLEGLTVTVRGDGAERGDFVVTGGMIDIEYPAFCIHVGMKYESFAETLDYEAGSQLGSSSGQLGRISEIDFNLFETDDFYYQANTGSAMTTPVYFRTPQVLLGEAPNLYTGVVPARSQGGWGRVRRVRFGSTGTGPCTVLSLNCKVVVSDN
jgi:hypothetical protein